MKKQICFAGFTELELEALQPSLASIGGAWECACCPDAASALEAMSSKPFNAMVVNLSPSGITDSKILQQAAMRYPSTLRFILGSVGDRELIVNCMGAAHQFISRPWKPLELITVIERSLALDSWLSSDKLRTFIPRLGTLPSLPATYFEVIKRAESPHSSVESVAEVIARDPALTARLLQMVNSSACGLTEKITSPMDAVSRLGLETVKSLVLCLQLFVENGPSNSSLSLDQLWAHSFSVAKLSAKIVLHCIASERMASDAYTAGLLHNIGQIVLATNLSNEYSTVIESARKQKRPLQEVELELMGVSSNQIGAYLLGIWGMPLPLVEATAMHPTPSVAKPVEFSVLTVVHVANVLAQEEQAPIKNVVIPKLDVEYLGQLDLPKKTDAWKKLLTSSPKKEESENPSAYRPSNSNTSHTTRHTTRIQAAPTSSSGTFKKLAMAAVILLLVGGGAFFLMKRPHTVSSPVVARPAAVETHEATVAPAASANEGEKAAPTAAAEVASPKFDAVKLQSIIYKPGRSVALINGQALQVGEKVNGVQVVSIAQSNVVLAYEGEQRTFSLK